MFSEEEKNRFEFIILDYDIQFPLSLKTISLFYLSGIGCIAPLSNVE